jgi:hypothetical protein
VVLQNAVQKTVHRLVELKAAAHYHYLIKGQQRQQSDDEEDLLRRKHKEQQRQQREQQREADAQEARGRYSALYSEGVRREVRKNVALAEPPDCTTWAIKVRGA